MRVAAPRWLSAVALTVGLVTGPVGGLAAPAAAQGELRVAIPWTPENLDPTMNLSSLRSQVGVSIFDSLVDRDGEGKIVGALAESWRLLAFAAAWSSTTASRSMPKRSAPPSCAC